jgi:hypothetical protein
MRNPIAILLNLLDTAHELWVDNFFIEIQNLF